MIGKLSGIIDSVHGTQVIMDVLSWLPTPPTLLQSRSHMRIIARTT
jgi:hypothetical protein